MNTIADNMLFLLNREGRDSVWYGDLTLIEECATMSNIQTTHPIDTIQRVLNGLEHSKVFKKGYIYADFSGRKRKYRCFTIAKFVNLKEINK